MRTSRKSLQIPREPTRKSDVGVAGDGLEALVRRFDPSVRRTLRRLVYSSSRVADLAAVFPGLAYALASRRRSIKQRRQARELVEAGAQLRAVARAMEIPLWLRRLPPEAFRGELSPIPASDTFGRRIVNHLPVIKEESALWLSTVLFGAKAGDEYFALWLAGQEIYHDKGKADELLPALAAYAWFSGAERTQANKLIVVPWRPGMAFDTAVCAAKSWLNRIRLVLQLRSGILTDPWLEPGDAMGFTFLPLLEQSLILSEAQSMHNCADQYSDRLSREKCRLFSMRRKGQRVATLEVGPHPREPGMLTVTQLKGRHNMPAGNEIWQAAYAWLASQTHLKRAPSHAPPERPLDPEIWEKMMLPYRLARRGAPWIPEMLSKTAFQDLDAGLSDLARRGGVSSWLFT